MTVKAPRAKSLRVIDRAEAMGGWVSGGIVDESFDVAKVRKAVRAAGAIDEGAFLGFFGHRLGRFRSMAEAATTTPSVAEESSLLDELLTAIEQVRTRLESLPPVADAYVNEISWKARSELFFDFQRRLDGELHLAWMMLAGAQQELDAHKGKSGAKPKQHRDWFLHDVAHWLQDAGTAKERAADVAAGVLRAVDVDAPDDPRKARDLVRKIEALIIKAN